MASTAAEDIAGSNALRRSGASNVIQVASPRWSTRTAPMAASLATNR